MDENVWRFEKSTLSRALLYQKMTFWSTHALIFVDTFSRLRCYIYVVSALLWWIFQLLSQAPIEFRTWSWGTCIASKESGLEADPQQLDPETTGKLWSGCQTGCAVCEHRR